MIDLARVLQAKVDRGAVAGADPAVQAACRETRATVDAYLAQLPLEQQKKEARELVARLQAPTPAYTSTVQPKRRGVVVAGKV